VRTPEGTAVVGVVAGAVDPLPVPAPEVPAVAGAAPAPDVPAPRSPGLVDGRSSRGDRPAAGSRDGRDGAIGLGGSTGCGGAACGGTIGLRPPPFPGLRPGLRPLPPPFPGLSGRARASFPASWPRSPGGGPGVATAAPPQARTAAQPIAARWGIILLMA